MLWWLLFIVSGICIYKLITYFQNTDRTEIMYNVMRFYSSIKMYFERYLKKWGWIKDSKQETEEVINHCASEEIIVDDKTGEKKKWVYHVKNSKKPDQTLFIVSNEPKLNPPVGDDDIEMLSDDPFMCVVVDLVTDTKTHTLTISLQEDLYSFYVCGNAILDRPFLIWFLRKFYAHNADAKEMLDHLPSSKHFSVEIIDNESNMISINEEDGKHLVIKPDEPFYDVH